jgi:hypothetical protein
MPPKKSHEEKDQAQGGDDSTVQPTEDKAPRTPQGIVPRYMNTGDRKKDFHRVRQEVPMIDPDSLVVGGQQPFLACPIDRKSIRVKQVNARDAAYMLTCDPASGNQSVYRLATDAEVAKYKAEHAPKK